MTGWIRRGAVSVALAGWTLTCQVPPAAQPPTGSQVEIAGDAPVTYTGDVPKACPPTAVTSVVRSFIAAFNSGDQTTLARIFEHGVLFTAWNPAPRGFFTGGGTQQLLDYFAERHAQHDTLKLTALHIQYGVGDRVGLSPALERRADDITAEVATTKAELECPTTTLTAWNQGGWARSPASVPIGFTLPSTCTRVGPALLLPESTQWRVDCGPGANVDLRAVLESALLAQGWMRCPRVTTAAWTKPLSRILTVLASPTLGDLPRLSEEFRTTTNCPF